MERRVGFASGHASGLQPRDVVVRDELDQDSDIAGSRYMAQGDAAVPAPRAVVEVVGLSVDEVTEAVELLAQKRQMASELTTSLRTQILAALTWVSEPAISPGDVTATQGVATLRARLLETPYETFESLAARRGSTPNATRTAIKRARDAGRVFSVQHGGRALMPAFQFEASGDVRTASQAVVATLRGVGLDGWQLWEWLASPTGWLDSDVPADLLDSEPEVVLAAARQYAEELAVGRHGAVASGQVPAVES
ncbi:hypothetical protein JCM18899A_11620 [Nocardioides sp. AN3]